MALITDIREAQLARQRWRRDALFAVVGALIGASLCFVALGGMPGTRLLAMHGARDLRPTAGEAAALDGSGGGPNGTAGDSSAVAMDLPGSGGGPNGTAGDSSAAAEAPPGSDGSGGGSSPAAVVQAGDGGGGGSKTAAAGGPLPCEASGYCSLDSSKVWHGDIATNEKLKEMLESVTYKKELIFTIGSMDQSGAYIMAAMNLVKGARDLGYAHLAVLMWDGSQCDLLPEPFKQLVSCIYDSRIPDASKTGGEPGSVWDLFAKRWELTARAVRLGFNVLIVDSDTALVDDIYKYLKSPQLGRYNFFMASEGPAGSGGANCGVAYFQNCHPSGPCVWALAEHTDRTIRQREAREYMTSIWPHRDVVAYTWEQALWGDIIYTVAGGVPRMQISAEDRPEGWEDVALEGPPMVALLQRMQQQQLDLPESWWPRTSSKHTTLTFVENMLLPNVSREWLAKRAPLMYPPERGADSLAWMEVLRGASPLPLFELGKAWHPPQGADAIPPEHFAYFPGWFAAGYSARGSRGAWYLNPAAQVVPHSLYLPAVHGLWKTYIMRGFGWWHWEINDVVQGGNVLGIPDPKLLMLAPGVQINAASEEDYLRELLQLVRLAHAMGRRFVLPFTPCEADWVGVLHLSPDAGADGDLVVDGTLKGLLPSQHDGFQVLEFPTGGPLGFEVQAPRSRHESQQDTVCLWMRYLTPDCVNYSPTRLDVAAYMQRSLQPEQAAPSRRNMLWHAKWTAGGGRDAEAPPHIKLSDAAALQAALDAARRDFPPESVPVLHLGAVPTFGPAGVPPELPAEYHKCYLFNPEDRVWKEGFLKNENYQRVRQEDLAAARKAAAAPAAAKQPERRRRLGADGQRLAAGAVVFAV